MREIVVIDQANCIGCAQCLLICEFEAIQVSCGLAVIKQDNCVACGICIDYCPIKAIAMEEEW